jgi:EmrB/QacA subfamily drug resistance transporter
MATLDSSIVNIALPTLTKTLGADLHLVKWVVVSYLLCITFLLLPFGRLADRFGRKPVFRAGFLIFSFSSLFCGLAPDFWSLLLFRTLQGAGAALLMANGPAIIAQSFPTGERGRALGILSMVVSAGLISGPSIGGLLIHWWDWRSIFWVNLPVGLLGFWLSGRFIPRDTKSHPTGPFDWPGAVLQGLLIISFILLVDPPAVSIGHDLPVRIPRWIAGLATSVFLGLFLFVERRTRAPLFDLSLLRIPSFGLGNFAGYLTFVAYSAMTVLMPFFLEEVLHFSTRRAGLAMTMIPLTIFLTAPISGRLSDRIGTRGLAAAGGLVGAIAFLAMAGAFGAGVYEKTSQLEISLAMAAIGLATGLFQSPNNSSIMGSVPHGKLGVASALLATIRNLGIATGTGLASGLFGWHFEQQGDYISALHFVFYFSASVALLAAGVSSLRRRKFQVEEAPLDSTSPSSSIDEDDDIAMDLESQDSLGVSTA